MFDKHYDIFQRRLQVNVEEDVLIGLVDLIAKAWPTRAGSPEQPTSPP